MVNVDHFFKEFGNGTKSHNPVHIQYRCHFENTCSNEMLTKFLLLKSCCTCTNILTRKVKWSTLKWKRLLAMWMLKVFLLPRVNRGSPPPPDSYLPLFKFVHTCIDFHINYASVLEAQPLAFICMISCYTNNHLPLPKIPTNSLIGYSPLHLACL